MIAAPTMVTAVLTASTRRAGSDRTKMSKRRARTNVPAATMVAAWMSAEAGVGPSIASGSQSWKGNCADLPATPTSRSEEHTSELQSRQYLKCRLLLEKKTRPWRGVAVKGGAGCIGEWGRGTPERLFRFFFKLAGRPGAPPSPPPREQPD